MTFEPSRRAVSCGIVCISKQQHTPYDSLINVSALKKKTPSCVCFLSPTLVGYHKNGFSRPLSRQQVHTWLGSALMIAQFYALVVPFLPQHSLALGLTYGALLAIDLAMFIVISVRDPAHPNVMVAWVSSLFTENPNISYLTLPCLLQSCILSRSVCPMFSLLRTRDVDHVVPHLLYANKCLQNVFPLIPIGILFSEGCFKF